MSKRWRAAVIVMGALSLAAYASSQVVAASDAKPAHQLVQFAQPGTPEAVVQAALVAALEQDEDKGFRAYLGLVHPSRTGKGRGRAGKRGSSKAIERIRRYSWKRFRKQAPDYVLSESAGGFALARSDPGEVTPATRMVRLFLAPINNERREAATPIRLERAGDGWLIVANSL